MSIKRLLASLLAAASLLSPLAALPAQAATVYSYPSTQSLIKSPSSATLYWYSSNGRRYVFPTLNTYYSWFSSDLFSRVTTLSDSAIAALPLGGNVTYRPGAKMIKIQTDPRVYVVSRSGVLRWVTSEYLAQQLYGANWTSQVQDVPDAFFSNYIIGTPIYSSSDYHVATEYHGVMNPDDSLSGPNPPVYSPPPSYPPVVPISGNLSASLSSTSVSVGQTSLFTARLLNSSLSASNARIVLSEQGVGSLKTCYQSLSCEVSVYGQSGNATRIFYATVYNEFGQSIDSNLVYLTIVGNTSRSFNGHTLGVTSSLSSGSTGQSVSIAAGISPSPYDVSNTTLELWNQMTGELVRRCYNANYCQANTYLPSNLQSVRYYATLTDTNGTVYLTGYSPYIQVGATQVGTATITTDKTYYTSGQTIYVSGSVQGYSNISNLQMEIYSERDGLIQTCVGTTSCNISRSAYSPYGTTVTDRFSIRVRDYLLNQYLPTAYSHTVSISSYTY